LNELIVAYDGIAVLTHSKNPVEQLTTTEIRNILIGTITQWHQLQISKKMKVDIHIYCQDSSDVFDYLRTRFIRSQERMASFVHTTSEIGTIQSVEKDPGSIGFIASGWIDSLPPALKILKVGRTSEDTDTTSIPPENTLHKFYSPHPAYIYLNYYPLKRALYMYTRSRVDLAAGFGAFVASPEGQKIILQHNLVPGTQKIKIKSD
jgi:ABC-type phosphate transport system substrate-binding protein